MTDIFRWSRPTAAGAGPAGLWVRAAGAGGFGDTAHRPAPFPAVPGDNGFQLLVGAPGEAPPPVTAIVTAVRSLAPAEQDRLVMTVVGSEPAGGLSLAQQVADVLGEPVRAHHGVPVVHPDGSVHRAAVDAGGQPTWRPFTERSSYRPGRLGVTVEHWSTPFAGAHLLAPARFALTADWVIDLVPAGLVVSPATAGPNPLLRCAPTDPEHVDLVIDCPDGRLLPDGMLNAVGRLADGLPPSARRRLRTVLTAGVQARSARALRWAVPAPQIPWAATQTVDQ